MLVQARGCPLKGISVTRDLASHIRRFTDNAWQRADAKDMSTIYKHHLDPVEKRRCAVETSGCEREREVLSCACS
jgi:hypothetical protein